MLISTDHSSSISLGTGRKTDRAIVAGREAAVSAGHPLAALAAMRILDAGGNATDAGVTAGLALSVLQPDMVGFAGVAPIILYQADTKEVSTISGLGRWPRLATVEHFDRFHAGELPWGVKRSVVPASVDAWVAALEKFGTISFKQAAEASFILAKEGFSAHELMCSTISEDQALYAKFPTSAAVMLPNGAPPVQGSRFVQPDLARTIRRLIEAEERATGSRESRLNAVRDEFYRGSIAKEIDEFYRREDGLLRASDLAEFRVGIEAPVTTSAFGYEVFSCGPWCQGPILLQFLNMLENDNLRALGWNSPAYIHLLTEVMKLAFADREAFFGDPDFVDVPIETLLSKEYAALRRSMVSSDKASPDIPPAGNIAPHAISQTRAKEPREGAHPQLDTTYLCVIDKNGNGFSATPSDGYCGVPIIPSLGFAVSPRGEQSWVDNNHPSSIAPRKRPRLTPNPALALKDGKIAMVFGTPGGDAQSQSMLQFFLNVAVFGMDPQSAVEAPRFTTWSFPNSFYPHHSEPGVLRLDQELTGSIEVLRNLGHKADTWPRRHWRGGGVCGIVVDEKSGYLVAGADPRRECYALAW